MTIKKISILALGLFSILCQAQLTIDAELRPRFEYRHGYKDLFPDNAEPAAFVSQRTRLNTAFSKDKYSFYLSLQDVRVWGDAAQLSENDKSFALHQAWAKINFTNTFALKVGRQEIIYDDSRMFGNVGWAQQARSHDLALAQLGNGNYKLDIGAAFNQEKEALTSNLYNLNSYKTFQYLWYNRLIGKVNTSILFLNNGMQDVTNEKVRYSQTIGAHLKFNIAEKLSANTNFYYQTGKDVSNTDLSAYLIGLDLNYKVSDKSKISLGGEIQSGTDYDETDKNHSFSPFYGTNHKFNGLMDYFYVGNHFNNVGLIDIYAKFDTKLGSKSNLAIALHNFSAQADINNNVNKQLGTELDLVYGYNFSSDVNISAGFSQMFASEGMEALKGGTDSNWNHWGWIMLTIKPELFKSNN